MPELIAPCTVTSTQNVEERQLAWDEQLPHQVLLDDWQGELYEISRKDNQFWETSLVWEGVETLF